MGVHARAKTVALLAALLVLPATLVAHDIPGDVTIQAYLKADGQRLRLLVRVPLQAMRDIDYPRRDKDFVDLPRADRALREAATVWVARDVELYEDDSRLPNLEVVAVRAALPSDRSFRSYEAALAHLGSETLPAESEFVWNQGLLDVLLETSIESDQSAFSIEPRWGRLGVRTITSLRLITPQGVIRAFELTGDPGLVRLDPQRHQVAAQFVRIGFLRMVWGIDHLLFLICLVIPFRRLRPLVLIVTSFTLAHSLALIASAYDLAPSALWFPPLIETLIATSIVYMALENIVAASTGLTSLSRRWFMTFAFGLVHGFAFSFALKQTLQFAGTHRLTSLLSFNVGIEFGQLLVLLVLLPILDFLFQRVVVERIGAIILSALLVHTGWHWMIERAERLSQYSWQWPTVTAGFILDVTRWLTAVVALAGVAWLAWVTRRHWIPKAPQSDSELRLDDELDVPKRIN